VPRIVDFTRKHGNRPASKANGRRGAQKGKAS
jgi:hypothetical protein